MARRPLEVRIWERMIRLSRSVRRQADERLAQRSVSPAQFFVLATLEREGSLHQHALSEHLGVTAANVSQLLAKLEASGLVERPARGTAKLVSLTARGRSLVGSLRPQHDAFIAQRFAALTREERTILLAWLDRLLAAQDEREAAD